ncbi:MAG: hypothetical protein KA712_12005 [Myxococcales bacterium]|nr:hypothetical protein [Myxococcales bacterium]
MTVYNKLAQEALASLDRSSSNIDRETMLRFFVASARLSQGKNNVPLATMVEYFDSQQHVLLSAKELAAAIALFEASGLWQVVESDLKPRVENWTEIPRSRNGHIASGKRDLRKWEKVVYQNS